MCLVLHNNILIVWITKNPFFRHLRFLISKFWCQCYWLSRARLMRIFGCVESWSTTMSFSYIIIFQKLQYLVPPSSPVEGDRHMHPLTFLYKIKCLTIFTWSNFSHNAYFWQHSALVNILCHFPTFYYFENGGLAQKWSIKVCTYTEQQQQEFCWLPEDSKTMTSLIIGVSWQLVACWNKVYALTLPKTSLLLHVVLVGNSAWYTLGIAHSE